MAATLNLSWQPLPVSRTKSISAMLVRHAFGSEGYTVQITDLSSVWAESLTKEDIIERAEVSESSIDPSEDGRQLMILLEKIKAAIVGEDGTALNLSIIDDGNRLQLDTDISLPRPFRPLKWRLCLHRMKEEAVKSEFVIPLLGWTLFQSLRVDKLAGLLVEKDAVITKILDKVESLGIDLESIFPSAGSSRLGRRGRRREVVAQHVKGLATFERHVWMEGTELGTQDLIGFDSLINGAFAGSNTANVQDFVASIAGGRDSTSMPDQKLDNGQHHNHQDQQSEFQRQSTPPLKRKGDESLQNRGVNEHQSLAVGDDSTDEENPHRPSTPIASKHTANYIVRSRRASTESPISTRDGQTRSTRVQKSGKIGGVKRDQDEPGLFSNGAKSFHDGNGTASTRASDSPFPTKGMEQPRQGTVEPRSMRAKEPAEDQDKISPGSSVVTHPKIERVTHAESPRKLGRIGGHSAKQMSVSNARTVGTYPPASSEHAGLAVPQPNISPNPTRRKLGRIGGRTIMKEEDAGQTAVSSHGQASSLSMEIPLPIAFDSSQPVSPRQEETFQKREEERGSHGETPESASAKDQSPMPPESSQQRANRKRTELQVELEEKAKSHGKKRRRF